MKYDFWLDILLYQSLYIAFQMPCIRKTLHSFLVDILDFHVHPLNLLPVLQKIFAMHSSVSHPIKVKIKINCVVWNMMTRNNYLINFSSVVHVDTLCIHFIENFKKKLIKLKAVTSMARLTSIASFQVYLRKLISLKG